MSDEQTGHHLFSLFTLIFLQWRWMYLRFVSETIEIKPEKRVKCIKLHVNNDSYRIDFDECSAKMFRTSSNWRVSFVWMCVCFAKPLSACLHTIQSVAMRMAERSLTFGGSLWKMCVYLHFSDFKINKIEFVASILCRMSMNRKRYEIFACLNSTSVGWMSKFRNPVGNSWIINIWPIFRMVLNLRRNALGLFLWYWHAHCSGGGF